MWFPAFTNIYYLFPKLFTLLTVGAASASVEGSPYNEFLHKGSMPSHQRITVRLSKIGVKV